MTGWLEYAKLDQNGYIMAEYIWIDERNQMHSKTQIISDGPHAIQTLPRCHVVQTQADRAPLTANYEIHLRPVAECRDPLRLGGNILVLCETYDNDGNPTSFNYRFKAANLMRQHAEQAVWFGIEQEYTILDLDGWPLGWPKKGFPLPEGPYYCGVGLGRVFGRPISESHHKACRYAGLEISGTNSEAAPSQWEYQLGPCTGIDAADQIWLSRYILLRIANEFGTKITFRPKAAPGDWGCSAMHTNVSSKDMRATGGLAAIEAAVERMSPYHHEHIEVYGANNEVRLTGQHDSSHIGRYSWGRDQRHVSVRIPRNCVMRDSGYFEDRRPGASADPYRE